jgi:very-short-patch-repair endonuclease
VSDTKPNRSRRKAGTTEFARQLRQGGNEAEALLWLELKARKLGGFRFVRQFPIGPYFADFLCREKKLIVELDGSQHAGNPRDIRRDNFLNQSGYSVLRFWNTDVFNAISAICETILAALNGQLTDKTNALDLIFKPAAKLSLEPTP